MGNRGSTGWRNGQFRLGIETSEEERGTNEERSRAAYAVPTVAVTTGTRARFRGNGLMQSMLRVIRRCRLTHRD